MNKSIIFLTLAGILSFFMSGCTKDSIQTQPKASVTPAPSPSPTITAHDSIMVSVDQTTQWLQIPSGFMGTSYEVGQLPKNNLLLSSNTVFIQLLKNLGNGVIRVGGNSSENVFWTGKARTVNTGIDSLTTTDIDAFSGFAKSLGWPVLFGLNLGNSTPSVAVNESQYLSSSLGSQLLALQIGNEPDLFSRNGIRTSSYSSNNFITEWESYYTPIHNALPQVKFAGPDVSYNTNWVGTFIGAESSRIAFADGHYYATGPGSDSTITYNTLLASTPFTENTYLQKLKTASGILPYRISECNSIYSGGRKGVSDIFASALWGLNFMWQVATNGCQGINFHGSTGGAYTPIQITNGVTSPRPLYYALLAFKYGTLNNGHILTSTITTNKNNRQCYAYSTTDGTSTYTTLINKDSVNVAFTVQLTKAASSMKLSRLTASSVTGTDVSFSGSTTNADGSFTYNPQEQHAVSGKSVVITLPAYSAAVVTFQ